MEIKEVVKNFLFDNGSHGAPQNLIKGAFQRSPNSTSLHRFASKGHAACMAASVAHLVGIVVKPIFYLLLSVVFLAFGYPKESLLGLGCAIVAPFEQGVQVLKAVAGILHPGAYFCLKS